MQIKLFTVSAHDDTGKIEEVNRFLRGNKILDIKQVFSPSEHCGAWHFSIRYIEHQSNSNSHTKNFKQEKIDYKSVLGAVEFARFEILRSCRKQLAMQDSVPAYAVFIDSELAEMAKLEEITLRSFSTIKGIGTKKTEKYGERFIQLFNNTINEETRKPDPTDI